MTLAPAQHPKPSKCFVNVRGEEERGREGGRETWKKKKQKEGMKGGERGEGKREAEIHL